MDAAERTGVHLAATPEQAVAHADWVISAVTASSSADAAASVAGKLPQACVYFDINSVSGGCKQASARLIEGTGAVYIDMAVMAPVHPLGHRTPVLVAGPLTGKLRDELTALDFKFRCVGDEAGRATTIKMVRSLFVKGQEAITVQCLMAAKAAGCLDEVRGSLEASFPELGWPDFASYRFERVARHGIRRAEEMRESAKTMDELGYGAGGQMARAVADIQQQVAQLEVDQSVLDQSLEDILAALPVPSKTPG